MIKIFSFLALASVCAVGGFLYFNSAPPYVYTQTAPKDWMLKQVHHDLKSYQSGISDESFELAKSLIDDSTFHDVYLITIENKTVRNYPSKLKKRPGMIVSYLQKMIDSGAKLPEIKFLLGNQDGWRYPTDLAPETLAKLPPVFVFTAARDDPNRDRYVLFPDDHTLGNHTVGYRKGWDKIYHEITSKRDNYPWDSKKSISYWRGLPTDNVERYEDGRSPRVKMTEISEAHPSVINAQFTEVTYGNGFIVKTLRPLMQILSIYPYVSYAKQMEYKILPSLDGHTCTYPGLLWRLTSGSLVMKQETMDEQWFYPMLTPGKDYVAIKQDMSDVLEKTKWALENDEKCQEIVANARQTVEENLTPAYVDAYIMHVLEEYEKLLVSTRKVSKIES